MEKLDHIYQIVQQFINDYGLKMTLGLLIVILVFMILILPLLRLFWGWIKNLFFKPQYEKWQLNRPNHIKKVARTEKKRLQYLRSLGEYNGNPYLYLGKNRSTYAVLHNVEDPSYKLLKAIKRWLFSWDIIEFDIKISDENRF